MRAKSLGVGGLVREVLQAAFRLLPWPTEPGLRRSGEPGPESPVIVTGNYDLTVRRVLRALAGVDAWVVVAPSSGINVWCAAAGGHLTTHQVVTALKTSGVAGRVRHRRAILPQLAATGVLARDVARRCGWRIRFGPVYAHDLPRYLAGGEAKTEDMRHVRFDRIQRLEMAAAWAGPGSLLAGGALALLRPAWALPAIALTWVLALAVFFAYERIPGPRRLLFAAAAVAVSVAATALAGGGAGALIAAGSASLALTALLTFDYRGSTPTAAGSLLEGRRWRITLDLEACRGAYFCWEVCPEACFEKRPGERKIDLAHDDRCVRCGACVVQCPTDALFYQDEAGRRVEPGTVRRFKLNLLGRRVAIPGEPPPAAGAGSGADAAGPGEPAER